MHRARLRVGDPSGWGHRSGILAILFGLAALLWPGITLGVLVILFGVYVLLEGVLALVWAIGIYAILFGALMIYLGTKLRTLWAE